MDDGYGKIIWKGLNSQNLPAFPPDARASHIYFGAVETQPRFPD